MPTQPKRALKWRKFVPIAPEEDLRQAVPDYSRDNDRDMMRDQARTDLARARRAVKGRAVSRKKSR